MSKRAPLIAGIAIAVVAALAVVLLVLPKMNEVGEAEDRLTAAEDQQLSLQAQLGSLQDAQAAAPETERQIALLEDQVPSVADLPALFNLLQAAADRSAVDFFSFSPGSPTADAAGSFSLIPSQISVTGSYFALDEFIFLLETLPRAAKVLSITVTPQAAATEGGTTTSATGSLSVQMSVEFYTTDASAGPGSVPGPTQGAVGATGAVGPTGAAGATGAPSEPGEA